MARSDTKNKKRSSSSKPKKPAHRPKRSKRRAPKKKGSFFKNIPLPVVVVDEHHGAFKATARAVAEGRLPEKVKLLHFDSHPDLGVVHGSHVAVQHLASGSPVSARCMKPKEKRARTSTLRGQTASSARALPSHYSIMNVYRKLDIASWVLPLVQAGHVDTVYWIAAHWCDQIKEGTYQMYTGFHKKSKEMKVAFDKHLSRKVAYKDGVMPYYEDDNSVCALEDLEHARPWTLTVCLLPEKNAFKRSQLNQILTDFSEPGSEWILDIDEDFFSCNNPFYEEFSSLFEDSTNDLVKRLYESTKMTDKMLKRVIEHNLTEPFSAVRKLPESQAALSILPKSKRDKMFREFRTLCRKFSREHRKRTSEAPCNRKWMISDIWSDAELHDAGLLWMLPHHISKFDEILALANTVDELLSQLPPPKLVTVATSRLDRYLPDCQAQIIHTLVLRMLRRRYHSEETEGGSCKRKRFAGPADQDGVLRWDKPKYSVVEMSENEDESDSESDIPE